MTARDRAAYDSTAPIIAAAREAYRTEQEEAARRREESLRRQAEKEYFEQQKAVEYASRSPLVRWFPEQTFEYEGRYQNGVVVRATGTDLLFCVTRHTHEGFAPEDWSVSIVRKDIDLTKRDWLVGAYRVRGPADVGQVIEERERPAPVAVDSGEDAS